MTPAKVASAKDTKASAPAREWWRQHRRNIQDRLDLWAGKLVRPENWRRA